MEQYMLSFIIIIIIIINSHDQLLLLLLLVLFVCVRNTILLHGDTLGPQPSIFHAIMLFNNNDIILSFISRHHPYIASSIYIYTYT